jgi:hypothetical protein
MSQLRLSSSLSDGGIIDFFFVKCATKYMKRADFSPTEVRGHPQTISSN